MIIGIVAPQGYGKTNTDVFFSVLFHKCMGLPLYSKTKIVGATCFQTWKKEQIFDLGRCVISWDELQDEMDSRGFKETNSRYYTRWIAKVRHKQAMLFYTCQEIGDVDRRVRNNTDYVWIPSYDPIKDRIDIVVIDWHKMELRRSICIQPASIVWNYYDTFEEVMPIEDFLPKAYAARSAGPRPLTPRRTYRVNEEE